MNKDFSSQRSPNGLGRTRRRVPIIVGTLVVVALVVVGLLVLPFGSHPKTPTGTQTSAIESTLAYDSCMRTNGITNMPEPNAQGGLTLTPGQSLPDVNSPQFQAAAKKCAKYRSPSSSSSTLSAAQLAEQLKFSQCMRTNGITDFPDPQSKGGYSLNGVDVNSAQFATAMAACQRYGGISGSTSAG